jgi:hypothetical protein
MSLTSRRWRRKFWRGSSICMRSKMRSAVMPPSIAGPCARLEVGQSWWRSTEEVYQTGLDRPVDPNGLAFVQSNLAQGATPLQDRTGHCRLAGIPGAARDAEQCGVRHQPLPGRAGADAGRRGRRLLHRAAELAHRVAGGCAVRYRDITRSRCASHHEFGLTLHNCVSNPHPAPNSGDERMRVHLLLPGIGRSTQAASLTG